MNDARQLIDAVAALRETRTPFLVATVVRVIGSSYRRPGGRLVATAEHRVAGSVSGGCLERDLIRTGFWRTRNGPVVVRYDSSDLDDPEAALGCGGIVDVLLERVDGDGDADAIATIERLRAGGRPSAMATVFESTIAGVPAGTRYDLAATGTTTCGDEPLVRRVLESCRRTLASRARPAPQRFEGESGSMSGSIEVLIEAFLPAPRLFVFGAGFDAVPVVESARRLGFDVTVWDSLSRFDTRSRFLGANVVLGGPPAKLRRLVDAADRAFGLVMSHDRRHDAAALAMLLESRAEYIGVLGPRHRTQQIASELDVAVFDDPRVHAPVGLDLGAETPDEIALAVTAEMLAAWRSASGQALRDRGRRAPGIHDAAAE